MESSNMSSEVSLQTKIKQWFISIPFITRCVLLLCTAIYFYELISDFSLTLNICINAMAIIDRYQYYRMITSHFFHIGIFHIFFNMFAFIPIGKRLERKLSSVKFLWLIILIVMISSVFYVIFSYLLYYTVYRQIMNQCSLGFSGIIFGLIVINTTASGISEYSFFGLFSIPAKYYPYVLLIIWQLLFPGISFLGHLSGILVGEIYARNWLSKLMFSDSFANIIENTYVFRNINSYDSFILHTATSNYDNLPTHSHRQQSNNQGLNTVRSAQGWNPVPSSDTNSVFTGPARTIGENNNSWIRSAPGPSNPTQNRESLVTRLTTVNNSNASSSISGGKSFPGQPNYITSQLPLGSDNNSNYEENMYEKGLHQLLSMGFPEREAADALQKSNNDVSSAVHLLTGN